MSDLKLDYPNAFKIQARMTSEDHVSRRCSTLSGGKMFLCDCGGLYDIAAQMIDNKQAIVDENGFVRVNAPVESKK